MAVSILTTQTITQSSDLTTQPRDIMQLIYSQIMLSNLYRHITLHRYSSQFYFADVSWARVTFFTHKQTMGHRIPMPIVRPVLICKAMGICLIFCKQEVRSTVERLINAVLKIPIARSPEATCFRTGRSTPKDR